MKYYRSTRTLVSLDTGREMVISNVPISHPRERFGDIQVALPFWIFLAIFILQDNFLNYIGWEHKVKTNKQMVIDPVIIF